MKHTPEAIAKMSAVHKEISAKVKGVPRPAEHTAGMRSLEAQAKAAASRRGRKLSPEHRAKCSLARKKWWADRKKQLTATAIDC
jgi:hypothetical protein